MFVLALVWSLLIASSPASLSAQESPVPATLSFQEWRDQQVLDAQNQMLRASARLAQLRAGKGASISSNKKSTRLPTDKVREAPEDDLTAAERDLKRAQEYVGGSGRLTFSNYIDVYLPTLKDNPAALQQLADKLSKDELAQIFRSLMHLDRDADARHNPAGRRTLALGGRR